MSRQPSDIIALFEWVPRLGIDDADSQAGGQMSQAPDHYGNPTEAHALPLSRPWRLELGKIARYLSDPGNPITDEQRGFFGRLWQALALDKPKALSGKQDPGYLDKMAERKRLLMSAVGLLDGAVTPRCDRIAFDIMDYYSRTQAGRPPVPTSEYEGIILALSSEYGKPLSTGSGVYKAIYRSGEITDD